jgi:hypothetical protein
LLSDSLRAHSFMISASIWLNDLVLGYPLHLCPLNCNSNALLLSFYYPFSFSWWNHCKCFSSNSVNKFWIPV